MQSNIEICRDLFGSSADGAMSAINMQLVGDIVRINQRLGWKGITINRVEGRRKTTVRLTNMMTGEVSPLLDLCCDSSIDLTEFVRCKDEIKIGMQMYSDEEHMTNKLSSLTADALEKLITIIWEKRRNCIWGGAEELKQYVAMAHQEEGLWNTFFNLWVVAYTAACEHG